MQLLQLAAASPAPRDVPALLCYLASVERELLAILAAWADRVWPAHAAATGAMLVAEADSRRAAALATGGRSASLPAPPRASLGRCRLSGSAAWC